LFFKFIWKTWKICFFWLSSVSQVLAPRRVGAKRKAARTPGVREKWAHEIREGTEVGDLNWGIGHLPSGKPGKHTKNY
jgi:hypothetical protein